MCQKLNCWEFRNCGMEPGGVFSDSCGTCPVPLTMKYDGRNNGRGAGRACWMVMDTPTSSGIDNPIVCRKSRISCCKCEFYQRVHREENSKIPVELSEISSDKFVVS